MELIQFFGYVIQQLKPSNINNNNNSSFNVIVTPSSGVWHITLRCDNRRHIIDVIIPISYMGVNTTPSYNNGSSKRSKDCR